MADFPFLSPIDMGSNKIKSLGTATLGSDAMRLDQDGGGGGGLGDFTPEEFTADGASTTFTLAAALVVSSVIVTLNGIWQVVNQHYTTDGSAVSFLHALRLNDKIEVRGEPA